MFPPEALLLALAGLVPAVVVLEGRGAWRGALAVKAAASGAVLAFAALGGASATPAGSAVLAALALCLAGDVLLAVPSPRAFRWGIVAFLVAHLAYLAAFALRAPAWVAAGAALVPFGVAAFAVDRALRPRVPAPLAGAVRAYVVVVTVMVALAAGAAFGAGPEWLLAAAALFWANDLLVARHRFLAPARWHRAVGLPLYFAAQAAFAFAATRWT